MTIKRTTRKRLWTASGNECAYPGCEEELIDFEEGIIIGEESHIRSPNREGPRFDPNIDENEVDSYSNLILFCGNHHTRIDQAPDQYPSELLEKWKNEHEKRTKDAPDISELHLDALTPSNLLVHVSRDELDCLREVVDWTPDAMYPEDARGDQFPIVVSLENFRLLQGSLSALLYQRVNDEPLHQQIEQDQERVIWALAVNARLVQEAISYLTVEGDRRKSELFE